MNQKLLTQLFTSGKKLHVMQDIGKNQREILEQMSESIVRTRYTHQKYFLDKQVCMLRLPQQSWFRGFHFSAIDQKTVPEELPVSGDPYNETTLELIFPGRQPRFKLNGKKLQLLEPLDRDDENLSHVVFQVRQKYLNKNDFATGKIRRVAAAFA